MTPTKKEYLMRYRWSVKALEQIDREITQLRLRALPGGISYDGMPHGSGGNHADLANYAAELDDYLDERREQREKLMRELEEITDAISQVEDMRSQILLRYRYIELKSWREIADIMGYDEDYVRRELHGTALNYFQVPTKSHKYLCYDGSVEV